MPIIKASALSGDSTLRFPSTMTKSRSRLRNWKRLGYRNRTANRCEELIGQRECRAHRVRNVELNDLEGFAMSPGQDIPVAIGNAIIMLAVSASKIERRSARRIGHQNNGYCPNHRFSFLAPMVLGRIDKLLQYLSRSVAARFCVWQSTLSVWLAGEHHPMGKSLSSIRLQGTGIR